MYISAWHNFILVRSRTFFFLLSVWFLSWTKKVKFDETIYNIFCSDNHYQSIGWLATVSGFSHPPTNTNVSAWLVGVVWVGFWKRVAGESVQNHCVRDHSRSSLMLSRCRHIATTSGAYLTYPAAQFNSSFVPSRTEWYQAAIARDNLLTLTPPRVDILREGGRFASSVTYALRAPARQG